MFRFRIHGTEQSSTGVATALAKLARIAWSVLRNGNPFHINSHEVTAV